MTEESFRVPIGDGALAGHRGGDGPPALLLHGGPAWSDYTEGCAAELDGLLQTHRYTQRGAPPSTVGGPYTIETHIADALAVLDHFGVERAWAVGHSWGGHLALHLAVAHPERLLGVICVEHAGRLRPRLRRARPQHGGAADAPAQEARIGAIEARRRAGRGDRGRPGRADGLHLAALVRGSRERAAAPVTGVGVECSTETNASISHHFRLSTLATGLPSVTLPALFIHGEDDPLPVSSSRETAALIRGAAVDTIPGCGHFPWLERPGEIRRMVSAFLPGRE